MPDCQSEAFCYLSHPAFKLCDFRHHFTAEPFFTWAAEQNFVKVPQFWDPILANETAYCIKSSFQYEMFEWNDKTFVLLLLSL